MAATVTARRWHFAKDGGWACRPATALAAILMLGWGLGVSQAQLSDADLARLREQGQQEGWTFTVGPNPATAYPLESLCGAIEPPGWAAEAAALAQAEAAQPPAPTRTVPSSFDWRSAAGCPPIRNQGGCGSCWAFAAVGALECGVRISDGMDVDLSEQWLVSCTDAGTCDGGWHTTALNYLKCVGLHDPCGDGGAPMEWAFPYTATDAPCHCPLAHPYCVTSWSTVTNNASAIKQAIYTYGPVATTVYVNDAFQAYTGGIFNACSSQTVNHAVVLVGWDDSQGVWIMRNSWGTWWGESGYMRITYGCSRIGYSTVKVTYTPADCNANGVADPMDIQAGTSQDCNANLIPDECELASGAVADCNANGIPDLCDIASGVSQDCDRSGVPDSCEIAAGTSEDCNINGVPDGCEIAAGTAADCNSNGVPDSCDVGAGLSEDCNANLEPDECELYPIVELSSNVMAPLAAGVVQQCQFSDPQEAGQEVSITIEAEGDLNYSNENVAVYLNGSLVGTVFTGEAFDCVASVEQLVVSAATFNQGAIRGPVTISLVPSDAVDAGLCPSSWIRCRLSYRATSERTDCNANGWLDACDIASGLSQDLNADGVPDECQEAPPVCRGDCNCDGSVGFADIDFFVAAIPNNQAAWQARFSPAAPSCSFASCDVNGNGSVGFDDIDAFVALVPSACPN